MSQDNSTNSQVLLSQGVAGPDTFEISSEFVSLACLTVLAVALGAKTYGENLKSLNYGRVLVIALYTLSWAFAFTTIIVVSTNNSKFFF